MEVQQINIVRIDDLAPDRGKAEPVFIGRGNIRKEVIMCSSPALELQNPEVRRTRERTTKANQERIQVFF